MTTIKCYHGTTKKGLRALLSGEGFKPTSPWTVSDQDAAMYVWPTYKIISSNGLEDSPEESEDWGIRQAFEAAEVQVITTDEDKLYTLVLNIPKDLLEDDYSCANMADVASYLSCDDFSKDFIESILESKFNIWRKPYLAMCLLDNPYFNKWALDEDLLEMAEALRDSGIEMEPLDHLGECVDVTEEYIKQD